MLSNNACLAIGISDYQHFNTLPDTVIKDAKDIFTLLTDNGQNGYQEKNTQLLLNQDATGDAIRSALKQLADHSNFESTIFIYISCHGGSVSDGEDSQSYLLPVDTQYDHFSSEAMIQSSISSAEFTQAIRAIPSRKVLVAFDCCHSGGIGEPKEIQLDGSESNAKNRGSIKSGLKEQFYETLRADNRAILSSCREDELSWVFDKDNNSLFTKHLLAGLQGGAASADGSVKLFNLFEYLQPKVTQEYSDQHPVFNAKLEENFSVSYCRSTDPPPGQAKALIGNYEYHAYISFLDREPDAAWVWETFLPECEEFGLKIAVSNDVAIPGVARVANMERGIRKSCYTLVILSNEYLTDFSSEFENTLAQSMSIEEGRYRVIPISRGEVDSGLMPDRLSMLTPVNLAHPYRAKREMERLLRLLKNPQLDYA